MISWLKMATLGPLTYPQRPIRAVRISGVCGKGGKGRLGGHWSKIVSVVWGEGQLPYCLLAKCMGSVGVYVLLGYRVIMS